MNILFAVFVGWTMLLMGLRFGRASSVFYDRLNETGLTAENKGEKRSLSSLSPREILLGNLIRKATGLSVANVFGIQNYGCWCGRRGGGKIVDNFDYCCKVHDFCEKDLEDRDKCGSNRYNMLKKFQYDDTTNTCTPASEYREIDDEEEKKCGYSVCLCDMEMVRCMGYYKNNFNANKIGWSTTKCAMITGGCSYYKPKADVVVLIQDSQDISQKTVDRIKIVVRRLLTLLGSDDTDYNFALATYATSRRMSCFGNAAETISYMDREYGHADDDERRGRKNFFNRTLSRMILKQFEQRRDGDTAKILVIFSDGRAEHESGDVMDTFRLEKTAKLLRVNKNIKIFGALIPNAQNTQRIQELKGIVSEPDDALDTDFSASNFDASGIADSLADRVKRLTKVTCQSAGRCLFTLKDPHCEARGYLPVTLKCSYPGKWFTVKSVSKRNAANGQWREITPAKSTAQAHCKASRVVSPGDRDGAQCTVNGILPEISAADVIKVEFYCWEIDPDLLGGFGGSSNDSDSTVEV